MNPVHFIWDLEDDPDGNTRHILDGHDVTLDEVEEILLNPDSERTFSRGSGYPIAFGWTSSGKYIAVVYQEALADPLMLRPITAFPAPPPTR